MPVSMRVTLSFEVAPGVLSDLLAAKILMNLLGELTADGINAARIGLTIDGYHPSDQT